jgi:hypothetical protein
VENRPSYLIFRQNGAEGPVLGGRCGTAERFEHSRPASKADIYLKQRREASSLQVDGSLWSCRECERSSILRFLGCLTDSMPAAGRDHHKGSDPIKKAIFRFLKIPLLCLRVLVFSPEKKKTCRFLSSVTAG